MLLTLVIKKLVAVLPVIDEILVLVTGFELDVKMLVVAASVVAGFVLVVAKIEVGF